MTATDNHSYRTPASIFCPISQAVARKTVKLLLLLLTVSWVCGWWQIKSAGCKQNPNERKEGEAHIRNYSEEVFGISYCWRTAPLLFIRSDRFSPPPPASVPEVHAALQADTFFFLGWYKRLEKKDSLSYKTSERCSWNLNSSRMQLL